MNSHSDREQPTMELQSVENKQSALSDGDSGTIKTNLHLDEEQWKAGRQELMILTTLSIISFIIATLARALNATSIATFWAGTSFLLANASFVPFIGAVSDILGRRQLLLSSVMLFTVGTIICCVANNIKTLLADRTIQGVGAGGIQTMSYVIVSDIIPLRQRPKYGNFTVLAWGLGAALGPVFGGVITEHTTWRWLFYINFPFCALGLFIIPFTVKLKSPHKRTFAEKVIRIDWVGSILFVGGTSSFLIGLTWGGIQFPWSAYQTWLPILLGGLAVIVSLVYEKTLAAVPFLRLSVFGSTSAAIIFFCTLVHGSSLYYIMFYYESVRATSPTISGVIIMAVNILMFPAGMATGITIIRRGKFLWANSILPDLIRGGFAIATLGNGLLLLLNETRPLAGTVFILLVLSIGQGMLLSALNVSSQVVAKAKDAAYAVTMFMFMRVFGQCLGVAVGTAVFENVLLRALQTRSVPNASEIAVDAQAFVSTLTAMPDGLPKAAIISAYMEGFRGVFYLLLSISAFCFVLSFFIKHHSMDKKLDSDHRLTKGNAE
ncbi:major facilitator superfamily domain-containing protein [Hypoxylon sp. FL1150]|nr:major facilitator superfamily domain-containing protein [Hypoxylon sp. FL1150]